MAKDKDYTNVLLEEMNDNIKTILEIVVPVRKELSEVKELASEIPEIKAKVTTIKAAVTDTNKDLHELQEKVSVLEAASESLHKIPKMSDRLEVIERDARLTRMFVDGIKHDTKMLKLRSDRDSEKLDDYDKRLKNLEQKAA